MQKLFLGLVVAVASMVLVDSLSCNSCSVSLFGTCLNSNNVTCDTNTSVCFTGNVRFPSLSFFDGFSNQGCREPIGCNATTNSTLLLVEVQTEISCCNSNGCNPVTLNSAAPATSKMTLSAAVGAALLACAWRSAL
ncbi:unnamed protein product [Ophioblennius macclurei]